VSQSINILHNTIDCDGRSCSMCVITKHFLSSANKRFSMQMLIAWLAHSTYQYACQLFVNTNCWTTMSIELSPSQLTICICMVSIILTSMEHDEPDPFLKHWYSGHHMMMLIQLCASQHLEHWTSRMDANPYNCDWSITSHCR